MMTPRGVADVHVYTPERVEARYGIRPDQVPDFIGLKGDTSDNIPGVPGIGDKTAGRADRAVRLARVGDRARGRALAGALEGRSSSTPTRRAVSKELATMRRDLDLDFDPAELVLAPPDRSQLKEIFRTFEFRNLLNRLDSSTRRSPPQPVEVTGVAVRGARVRSSRATAASATRSATTVPRSRPTTGVVVGPRPSRGRGRACRRTMRSRRASTRPTTRCSPRT